MKGKNYKIVSLYSFFPFQENLILDLKHKLLEIENESDNTPITSKCCNLKSKSPTENNFAFEVILENHSDGIWAFV